MGKRETKAESSEDYTDVFEWSDRWQHILFFFLYVMNYSTVLSFVLNDGRENGEHGVLQFLILIIAVGIPVVFLQNSIGQYTHSGCLFIGEMFPVTYGLGYSMLIISSIELLIQIFYSSKLVYYAFVTTFNQSPPWMKCHTIYYRIFPNCISKKDIDLCPTEDKSPDPCFAPGTGPLAAYLFKETYGFGREELPPRDSGVPWIVTGKMDAVIFHVFHASILYVTLLFGTSKSMKTFYTALRMGIAFCLLLLTSLVVMVFIQPGAFGGVMKLMMDFLHTPLLSADAWLSAFKMVIRALRLAEGGHILFGSFIPKRSPDYWRPMILIAAFVVIIITVLLYYHLFIGLVVYKLNMPVRDVVPITVENIIFVLFPTFLGILPSSYFFCFVFFAVLCLMNFSSLVVKVMVIEKTITSYFRLSRYQVYVRFTICTLGTILALLYDDKDIFMKMASVTKMYEACTLILVCVVMIVVNLYGIQKFSDDVQYTMMVKVKTPLKLAWIAMPIIACVAVYLSLKNIDFKSYAIQKIFLAALVVSPMVIAFVVVFFKFAKKKNMIGLFRPTDRYGPPDLEDRILRVLYNPRLTVKYKRHVEICFHECLLNSNAVKKAIEDEIDLINKFTRELQHEGGSRVLADESVLLQFEKHQKYLLRAIKQSKKEERSESK